MCLDVLDYAGIAIVVMLFSETDTTDPNVIVRKVEERINND